MSAKTPRRYWASLPWSPRDLRAGLALVASIAGAGVMTGMSAWLVWILWRGGWAVETAEQRLAALAWALFGTLIIVGITISAFGLAINRRVLRGKVGNAEFEASGGEDALAPVTVTTTTAVTSPATGMPDNQG